MPTDTSQRPDEALQSAVLSYRAPFLVQKLLEDQVVKSEEEAELLFTEVKRYLLLSTASRKGWGMYSRRVDQVWHYFILFTNEYSAFCQTYFGRFIHHGPRVGGQRAQPLAEPTSAGGPSTFRDFRQAYEDYFQIRLPLLWRDASHVRPSTHILNPYAASLEVEASEGTAQLVDLTGVIRLEATALAAPALRFIADTSGFYVRELPGELTEEEQLAIVASLVRSGVLKLGR